MRAVVVRSIWRPWSRLALFGALAAGVAGCSSDTARFGNPNANPFASQGSRPAEMTGTVQPAPTSRVATQSLPPPPAATRPATVSSIGVSGGGGGMGSYTPSAALPPPAPPPPPSREITGSIGHDPHPNRKGDGSAIVVGTGETAESLASKYGVPAHAILKANGLKSAAEIHPGQRLIIPKYNLATAPAAPHHAPAPTAAPVASAESVKPTVHVVAHGDTLMSISRRYHKPVAQIAAANNIALQTRLHIGDRIVIPGHLGPGHVSPDHLAEARSIPPVVAAPKLQAPAPRPIVVAEAAPVARVAESGASATASAGTTAVAKAPAFRWPLRGRVIAAFGTKPNGDRNDGIDLAVPQGTDVRAAEDGVVAYAGNELKGYGNLILIRHDSGYVTAYANTSELMVKRNDRVRRGQVIAKSGQSGGVGVPQLHFEIRKGQTPVDPAQFLPTGG
jgi:murein DD-endopeptidase MepM/ murein hydrolase activator NlpD